MVVPSLTAEHSHVTSTGPDWVSSTPSSPQSTLQHNTDSLPPVDTTMEARGLEGDGTVATALTVHRWPWTAVEEAPTMGSRCAYSSRSSPTVIATLQPTRGCTADSEDVDDDGVRWVEHRATPLTGRPWYPTPIARTKEVEREGKGEAMLV